MNKDEVKPSGKLYNYRLDDTLNTLQRLHMNGEIDLYAPLKAYYERYDDKGKPIPGTRERKDLPSIAQQWKTEYNKRRTNNG